MPDLSKTFKKVVCLECGHEQPPALMLAACPECNSPWLDAGYDYAAVGAAWPHVLAKREASLWRYAELLPVQLSQRITTREGWTPLLHAQRLGDVLGHPGIYLKDERQSSTSSFKDRQAALAVSAMAASGIKEAVIASTGNAAAAYAAYCARAGIKLWVFVTSLVPGEKMREVALYGAEVIKVTGTYDQAKVVAANYAKRHNLHLDRGAKSIAGKESMKTIAYEMVEQLGWRAPDWYVQAVSGGIGPVGVWKGFNELLQMGLIEKLPKLAIVQSEGCNPMVQAFHADKEQADPVTPQTAITILSTGDPGYAYTLLYKAAKSNGGTMIDVSDEAAFRALRQLARTEGISVEPATAVAFAGVEKLIKAGTIKPDETVVVNASGHTLPVEKFILGDQRNFIDINVDSHLTKRWGMPEEGLGAALEHLDEMVTTVVVIDDSPRDSRLIRRLLQRHRSYRVFEANDPQQGLELVQERQPDLVVLDLLMPGMDGFDVMDALKADPATADVPVIVVSGKDLSQRERSQLEQQNASLWVKGNYATQDLVDHIVSQVGDAQAQEADAGQVVDTQPTLLIIDDNPLDERLLRRTLKSMDGDFNIVAAHTGEQALLLLRQIVPTAIILDLMLPDMTGFSILTYIRQDPLLVSVPVVVLTAKDLTREEKTMLEGQVDTTLIKGMTDRTTLRDQVASLIGDQQAAPGTHK